MVDQVSDAVGYETARSGVNTLGINRGQAMVDCQRDDQITVAQHRRSRRNHDSAVGNVTVRFHRRAQCRGALDQAGPDFKRKAMAPRLRPAGRSSQVEWF